MFLMEAACGKRIGRTSNTLTPSENVSVFQMKMGEKECLSVLGASILRATVGENKTLDRFCLSSRGRL